MCGGNRSRSRSVITASGERSPTRNATIAAPPGTSSRNSTADVDHPRALAEAVLHFPDLNTEPPDLDLVVDPAEIDEIAVRLQSRPVSGGVHAFAGISANGSGRNTEAVRAGRPR